MPGSGQPRVPPLRRVRPSMSQETSRPCRPPSHVVSTSDGVNYTGGSGGTISNSLFANNGDDGIDLNDDVATHVVNNVIRDNRDDGIEFRVRSGSSPLTLDFTGNVITGNKE